MEQAKRNAVIELYRAGHSAKDITNLLKYNKSTVWYIIKRYRERGESTRKMHKARSDKKRTETFIKDLKTAVEANPGTPMTVHAKNMDVGVSTISRAINRDMGFKSYALRVRHLLTEAQKEVRFMRGKKILNSLKSTGGFLHFFSDEKIFTVDRSINRQNSRWICREPLEVPMVFTSKNPASVMVLGVICSNGEVMPPHFFKRGQTVNKETYLDILQTVVKPWMDSVASGMNFTFQQDSAPAHKAKVVQEWLKASVPHFWDPQTWPSNSPDMNPCDYYL